MDMDWKCLENTSNEISTPKSMQTYAYSSKEQGVLFLKSQLVFQFLKYALNAPRIVEK